MLVELTLINIFLNLLLLSIWLKRGFSENKVNISVVMFCLVLNMICVMLYI